MRIEIDDFSRPQVLALLEEHLRNMYELSPPEKVFAFDLSKLKAPEITFWTIWENGDLLGCAALKELSPSQGEIKSMRTPKAMRRRGAGRTLLAHIVKVSRGRKYEELFLETGCHADFEAAQKLYRSAGFVPCGPFGSYRENSNSVFMSMRLQGNENLMTTVTIYHNPKCETSRNTLALIRNAGIEPTIIEYLQRPPSREQLAGMIKSAGLSVREALREKGTPFAELGLGNPKLTDEQLLDAMMTHPILINRPFVITERGTVLSRPSERVLEILPAPQRGYFAKEDGEVVINETGERVR